MSRPTGRPYRDGRALWTALSDKLKQRHPGPRHARALKVFTFTRLLGRLDQEFADAVTLKGGMALELRHPERARMTKDVDLRLTGDPTDLHQRLVRAGAIASGDFLTYTFAVLAPMTNPGLVYGGQRFLTTCWRDDHEVGTFKVEVGVGDPMHGPPDLIACADLLAFAGIAPPTVRVYPIETHLAEKLHAYSFRYAADQVSSRVKDLPDLAILASLRSLDAASVRAAIDLTFTHRATHPAPPRLGPAPESWRAPYAAIARKDALPWPDLDAVYAAAAGFLDPVLDPGRTVTTWQPTTWAWA